MTSLDVAFAGSRAEHGSQEILLKTTQRVNLKMDEDTDRETHAHAAVRHNDFRGLRAFHYAGEHRRTGNNYVGAAAVEPGDLCALVHGERRYALHQAVDLITSDRRAPWMRVGS